MRDAISIFRAQELHPAISKRVIATIDGIEAAWPVTMKIRIVQGLRTFDEQNALYAQGRTKAGPIVTKAKGGQSFHNYGLAFDFAIMYDKDGNGTYETLSWDINYDFNHNDAKDWQEVVKPFKALGFTWGGDFRNFQDDPHLERTFGYDEVELLNKYKKGDFIKGTQYVNL